MGPWNALERTGAAQEDCAFLFRLPGKRSDERLRLDSSRGRRPQRSSRGDVRFALSEEGEIHHLEPLDSVGGTACGQRFEVRDFMGVRGDDELATSIVRHVVGLAKPVQPLGSLDAQARLERIRGIVDAGVDDAAVVRRRFLTETWMAFGDGNGEASRGQFGGGGESGDTPANN